MVITTTYKTSHMSLNVWKSEDKEVTVGFSAKLGGGIDGEAKGQYFKNSFDDGWLHYEPDVSVLRSI